jgi:hypothetical protein
MPGQKPQPAGLRTGTGQGLSHRDRQEFGIGQLRRALAKHTTARRAAALITTMIRMLATDTVLWTDDVWVVDSTPVECGRSKETTRRSDLAGWAEYGYCASHSTSSATAATAPPASWSASYNASWP